MLAVTLLALSMVVGVPMPIVAMVGLGLIQPWLALGCVVVWGAVASAGSVTDRSDHTGEAVWLGAVAAELRGGAALRTAMIEATVRMPLLGERVLRRLRSGSPLGGVVSIDVGEALPATGRLVGPAVRIAAVTGAGAAPVFGRLAIRAQELADAEREQRSATAAVRLSAGVVGGMPLVVVTAMAVTGRLGEVIAAGPLARSAVVAGIALQLTGVAVVLALSRKGGR